MKLSELKDDIAGCIPDYGQSIDPDFAAKSAQAILDLITARLHECVKPLEWVGDEENCYSIADMGSRYYEVAVVDVLERPCDHVWSATYTESGEIILGLGAGSFEAAKAAAQAYYAAQIIAGLDL